MSDPNEVVFAAAAFAARAHQHHFRNDGKTPYFSHPVRVMLVVRQLFGFDDPQMLAAALLHDTLEDTTTDYDDLIEHFGEPVATWVAALSKDSRLQHDAREDAYARTLAAADWPVKAIKLADLYDNTNDSAKSSPDLGRRTVQKAHFYLEAIRRNLPDSLTSALRLVERKLNEVESSLRG